MEHKYRAWDKKKKLMHKEIYSIEFLKGGIKVEGCGVHISNGWATVDKFCEGQEETEPDVILMQYTGLKDKNGVEIYEGDIVESNCELSEIVFGKIGYDGSWNGLSGFALKSWYNDGFYELNYYIEPEDFEVIGNIFENQELLEVKK